MAYVWLLVKTRKQVMKDYGFYIGKVDSKKDTAYRKALKKVNKKYLPSKFHTDLYYKETDIVLRNLRRLKQNDIQYFELTEFKCNCKGRYCSGYPGVLNARLLINLDMMREEIGPITITSGMRCQEYNDSLEGSSTTSYHLPVNGCKAADICAEVTRDKEGRDDVKALWKTYPKAGYTYSDTPNMYTSVHVQVK